jgi:uncharacterized membrane protein
VRPVKDVHLVYATRWVTNFCAPTFVLLAGVSAWIQHVRGKDTGALSIFLVRRGLWLVVLGLTVISFGWSFSIPLFLLLQVIWAIGWSMVALAALVWAPYVGWVTTIAIVYPLCRRWVDVKRRRKGRRLSYL